MTMEYCLANNAIPKFIDLDMEYHSVRNAKLLNKFELSD